MTAVLRLPFPPSVNGLFAGKRRRYVSPRYRRWRDEAGWLLKNQKPQRWDVPVMLSIHLTAPDRRQRDASNFIKAIEDLLVGCGVLADDSRNHVRRVNVEWTDVGQPGATVTISPAT